MKRLISIFILLLSIHSSAQKKKVLIIRTSEPVDKTDEINGFTFIQQDVSNFPNPIKNEYPLGKHTLYLRIEKNCQIKVIRNYQKDPKLTDSLLDELETLLIDYKLEHYHNDSLATDCSKLYGKILPINIVVPE